MAGVKITDLGPLTTAVSGDLLYIVDISDNTGGLDGTSKKITLANLKSALDVSSDVFQSTETTPTGFDSLGINEGSYLRIGEIVHYGCNIVFSLEATGIGLDQTGEFDIDFPEKVNNFSLDWYSFNLSFNETLTSTFSSSIIEDNLKATITINSAGTGAIPTDGVLYFTAIYKR
jgi:hypothetical protein